MLVKNVQRYFPAKMFEGLIAIKFKNSMLVAIKIRRIKNAITFTIIN